jgi:hypothetical protein
MSDGTGRLGRRALLRGSATSALLGGALLGGALLGGALVGRAAPPDPPVNPAARKLANRLELWSNYARKSQNLVARYTSTRKSPLLVAELVESGMLAFVAPALLVLRDDGVTGSTTRIEPAGIAITPNDPSLPRRPLPPRSDAPALRWLADHLLACFAPGDGSSLTVDARTEIPSGRTPRLNLMPPRDSVARTLIRSMTLTLDQVGGAVVRVEIAESDGSSFVLQLSDHRQNVEQELLDRVLG